ncbi:MAG: ATP citrate synthase [Candidatus Gracilibacteria bacterium]|nr:ATP citrate synthase [Candidatus Gracilibacteria bacterium]
MFTKQSGAVLYGLQLGSAQKMLDFDFLCGRDPSVIAFINEGKSESLHKLFYGANEILIHSFPSIKNIPLELHKKIDTLVNFASFRSAGKSTKDAMESGIFKNIVIVAEGIPERETREIIDLNNSLQLNIVGPSTVGAMEAGVFRAGNTGGSLDNIIASKLDQTGSVGFVSKSGGMSNEMRRVIADRTDGTSLSIALGGDKYTVMQFSDAAKMMEKRDDIKMIVVLGEIGGKDELVLAEMITKKEITKPVVAWCIGTISEQLTGEVQFGHAGAKSNHEEETSNYKNKILKESGAYVPYSFMDFGDLIQDVFEKLSSKNTINSSQDRKEEIEMKRKKINNRKKTLFTSTISDERDEELHYNKKPISSYIDRGSFAHVIGNLWLKTDLPEHGLDLINNILMLLADHGPAVSGANNSIVTARAGNDLKSSLISGLATIGPRFGGAIDGAATCFSDAVYQNISAQDFVDTMKKSGKNIPGIGHKVKSKFNPDKRCEILLKLSKTFPDTTHLDFALSVEKITLEKKSNLILNVDGMIAALLLDLFHDIGMTHQETKNYIDAGIFNAFFILARTVGFIGHIIDQKRLKEPLHRTPWDDILYE